ncbi:hypothetical protein J6590_063511 [Homalodisca vitripennis]|nr:hypothetical protein J6590_063511 [Homalodisca vitripennis]
MSGIQSQNNGKRCKKHHFSTRGGAAPPAKTAKFGGIRERFLQLCRDFPRPRERTTLKRCWEISLSLASSL